MTETADVFRRASTELADSDSQEADLYRRTAEALERHDSLGLDGALAVAQKAHERTHGEDDPQHSAGEEIHQVEDGVLDRFLEEIDVDPEEVGDRTRKEIEKRLGEIFVKQAEADETGQKADPDLDPEDIATESIARAVERIEGRDVDRRIAEVADSPGWASPRTQEDPLAELRRKADALREDSAQKADQGPDPRIQEAADRDGWVPEGDGEPERPEDIDEQIAEAAGGEGW